MTKRRPWPNAARQDRDAALMEAKSGRRALEPILTNGMTREEQYRRIGIGLMAFGAIERLLGKWRD